MRKSCLEFALLPHPVLRSEGSLCKFDGIVCLHFVSSGCDICYGLGIKIMFGSTLTLVVCKRARVLSKSFVSMCVVVFNTL
jgi:hypothetical protein